MAKTKQQTKDAEMAVEKAKLTRLSQSAEEMRKTLDWQWFLYDLYYDGNHYARYDKGTQQILTNPDRGGSPKLVINKIYSTVRAVRNYTLRNRPRAEVTPMNLQPENIDQTVKLNKYLDYLHDRLGLRDKLRDSVLHALKYSTGFWQILWNEDKQEIEVNVIDPYDLYWDPVARYPSEASYVVLEVRRKIEDLLSDPKYAEGPYKENLQRVKADNLLAASQYKARTLQQEKGGASFNTNEKQGEGTVIVKEFWCLEAPESKDGKATGDKRVVIKTMAGGELIRKEETDLTILPFFRLRADSQPLKMYGIGWIKNLIPLNKQLNRLESQVAEWNDVMVKGKYVVDKGSGVRSINNQTGQFIEKKPGKTVTQMNVVPMPNSVQNQIQNIMRYFEDIGAMNEASQGRLPPGASSGKAIEALQVGDANNMSELIENIETFLEEVYEYILFLVSQKYQFSRNIIAISASKERDFIRVIGDSAENKPEDALVVAPENIVDVKITSWLAQTSEARRDILKELYELQVIDDQTLLEGYEIGAVADIIQRVKQKKAEDAQAQLEMERQQAEIGQQQPIGAEGAIAMIRSIINGQMMELPERVNPEFVEYLGSFLTTQEAQQLPQEVQQIIANMRDQASQRVTQGV